MRIFQKPPRPDPLYCAVDIQEFPAQALAAYEPSLRGKPFVVTCQDPENHKTAVWACSAEALSLGAAGGMPVAVAIKRFPQIVAVMRNKELERAACDELRQVFDRYSPQYSVADRGKGLIDLTATPASRTLSSLAIAASVRDDILKAIALDSLAIGVARSAVVARLLAKKARPSGICLCEAGAEFDMLSSMESSLLPGLSAPLRQRLAAYGLTRIGQVRGLGREALVRRFGGEGERLYALTMGLLPEREARPKPALMAETTLDRDINDMGKLLDRVRFVADKLCFLLKSGNHYINRFTFHLTYGDNKAVQRTVALTGYTNNYLEIAGRACGAFTTLYQRRVAVKTLKLSAGQVQEDPGQTELFETERDRRQRALGVQITRVREKTGFESIRSGAQV
jgi:DNA polymerase IV